MFGVHKYQSQDYYLTHEGLLFRGRSNCSKGNEWTERTEKKRRANKSHTNKQTNERSNDQNERGTQTQTHATRNPRHGKQILADKRWGNNVKITVRYKEEKPEAKSERSNKGADGNERTNERQ